MRSAVRKLIMILASLLLLVEAGCSVSVETRYEAVYYDLFDTVTKLSGYAVSEEAFAAESTRIYQLLSEYDSLYDIYHDSPAGANLKTVNDCAGSSSVRVDERILDLLEYCREVDRMTDHRVDITLGPVLKLWHDAREAALSDSEHAALPEKDALEQALFHTGFDKLEVNRETGSVYLNDPLARLDVGAVAKGYAAARAAETMQSGYLLSLGGNVVAKGCKPGGNAWTIGIQDPDDSGTLLHTIRAEDLSIVTSGDYQRSFWLNGIRYHHIIDRDTLFPAQKWRAVTVICRDSALADALSTALFLSDLEEGVSLLSSAGADALWVGPDGFEYATEGFSSRRTD